MTFRLVRAEPTPGMDAAASKAPYHKGEEHDSPGAPLWVWLADADFDITLIRAGYRAMLAAVPAVPVQGVTEAMAEVIAAARDMPRATLTAGHNGTINQYPLPAHAVWRLDRALTTLDRLTTQHKEGSK